MSTLDKNQRTLISQNTEDRLYHNRENMQPN
jgi:hypothetical protein